MKKRFALSLATMLLCTIGPAFAGWTVVNLNPAVSPFSYAYGVSGGKQVGKANGQASLCSGSADSWVSLHPAGAGSSDVRGISGSQQVGSASFGTEWHAGLWSGTAASWVDLHPAGALLSQAYGCSGDQQVGYAQIDSPISHAMLWSGTADSWEDLHPEGATESFAYGCSAGQQVGYTYMGGNRHAALWTGSAGSRVDLNPSVSTSSQANAVCNGQQVGWAKIGGVTHAGLWHGTAASWVDLHPASSTRSEAYGVSGGKQAGAAVFESQWHAGFWSGTAASYVDLHAFLPEGMYSESHAYGIDASVGEIWVAGWARNTSIGKDEAILWHYTADAVTIPEAKKLVNDQQVTLLAKTITYAEPDCLYIEEDSRCMGIRVEKVAHGLAVGMRVDIVGNLKTNVNRERYIMASVASQSPAPGDSGTIYPVGMKIGALGGDDWSVSGTGGQRRATGSTGLNNIGLLVETFGRFAKVDDTTFTLEDGSGVLLSCTVLPGMRLEPWWEYATAAGISSLHRVSSALYVPSLLVRDVQPLDSDEFVSPPGSPTGQSTVEVSVSHEYATSGSTSSLGHTVEYSFNWGDGTVSPWSTAKSAVHSWNANGVKSVTVKARCQTHTSISATSEELLVTVVGGGPPPPDI